MRACLLTSLARAGRPRRGVETLEDIRLIRVAAHLLAKGVSDWPDSCSHDRWKILYLVVSYGIFVMYPYMSALGFFVRFALSNFLKTSFWISLGYGVPRAESSENVGAIHYQVYRIMPRHAGCAVFFSTGYFHRRVLRRLIQPFSTAEKVGVDFFTGGRVIIRVLR